MHRLPLSLFVLLFAALAVADASAQSGVDEVITWRSYSAELSAHVRIFDSGDRNRALTVVIEEANDNSGGPVLRLRSPRLRRSVPPGYPSPFW